MKKILLSLFIIGACIAAHAQTSPVIVHQPQRFMQYIVVASYNTAGLPSSPYTGEVVFNTDSSKLGFYNGVAWTYVQAGPAVSYAPGYGIKFGGSNILFDSAHVRKIDSLYAITDSTYAYYINGAFRTFKARGSVFSVNGRIGAVVLNGADITAALGYTPANANTIITINGLAQNLTGNISYTIPTNFVDSIRRYPGNDTVWYFIGATKYFAFTDSIGGTITGVSSFNTRTGAVTLTSGDVTTALAYTPLVPANNLSDITSASTARTNLGLAPVASSGTFGSLTSIPPLVYQDSFYANPSWITSLAWSKITGFPYTPPNTTNKYWNGFGNFVALNTDSITQGTTNKFFATSDTSGLSLKLDSIRRPAGTDSIYGYHNGVKVFQYIDSGAMGGTDSAVIAGYGIKITYPGGAVRMVSVDTTIKDSTYIYHGTNTTGVSIAWVHTLDSIGVSNLMAGNFIQLTKNSDSSVSIADTASHISDFTNDAGFITASSTNTLTNKSISGSTNTLTNIGNSSLTNSTISGISLGSNLNNLTPGYGIKGSAYNGSTPQTWTFDSANVRKVDSIGRVAGIDSIDFYINGHKYEILDSAGAPIAALPPGNILLGNASSIATDTPLVSDLQTLPVIKQYVAAQGLQASNSVSNYPPSGLDSATNLFTNGASGTVYSGWLSPNTSGDSIQVYVPFGVCIGNSIIAGHPWHYSGLELGNIGIPDSDGVISYYLSQLTHMPVKNRGWGSQYTAQIRARFLRDAIGLSTTTPNDIDGTQTLWHKPSWIVLEGGINDIASSVPIVTDSVIESNFIWMAKTAFQYQIPLIILNIGGDGAIPLYGTFTAAQQAQALAEIKRINLWMASGVLQQYGAVVIDMNSFWNNPSYGNNNLVGSSYVNTGDLIHFTKPGYDSLAALIMRVAKIPILTKMVFVHGVSPANGITNFNTPTGVTVNGNAFTFSNSVYDTISITQNLPDSMWIKITSSTGGHTQTGFNNIFFKLDNNPTNQLWYSQKRQLPGGTVSDEELNYLHIRANSYQTLKTVFLIQGAYVANTPYGGATAAQGDIMRVIYNNNGYSSVIVNGTTNTTILNALDALSIYGNVSTNGTFRATYVGPHQIGNFTLGGTTTSTTGQGISYSGGLMTFVTQGNNSGNQFLYKNTNGLYQNFNGLTNGNTAMLNMTLGVGTIANGGDTISQYSSTPTYNITSEPGRFGLLPYGYYNPINTSLQGYKVIGEFIRRGTNYFNDLSGSTNFGTIQQASSSSPEGSAIVTINDTTRGLKISSMTTAQRNNIGYVKSLTVTQGSGYTSSPTYTVSGGTGSGVQLGVWENSGTQVYVDLIEGGKGYNPGTAPTISFSGGGGTGLSATCNMSGPDSGLVIFNTDIRQLQQYTGTQWVNIGEGVRTTVSNSAYTILQSDKLIAYTNINASYAVTLPSTTNLTVGQSFEIVDESGSASPTNTITIVGVINGSTNPTAINSAYGNYKFYWNGVAWFTK